MKSSGNNARKETEKIEEKDIESRLMGLTVAELKSLKDSILQLKQGEALERTTHPQEVLESLGLGFFGSETNFALNTIIAIEQAINIFAETPDDKEMEFFAKGIAVASGSRQAKRLEGGFDTIGKLGGGRTQPNREFPMAEHMPAREPE